MKKSLSVVLVLLLLILSMSGCHSNLDLDKTVEKLKSEGLTVIADYTTADELVDLNTSMNAGIRREGKSDTIAITRAVLMLQGDDESTFCMIYECADEDQAKICADVSISTRSETSDAKIAQKGCAVILTNLEIVQQITGLDFK